MTNKDAETLLYEVVKIAASGALKEGVYEGEIQSIVSKAVAWVIITHRENMRQEEAGH